MEAEAGQSLKFGDQARLSSILEQPELHTENSPKISNPLCNFLNVFAAHTVNARKASIEQMRIFEKCLCNEYFNEFTYNRAFLL